MSRTQDVVLARVRILARRWWGTGVSAIPEPIPPTPDPTDGEQEPEIPPIDRLVQGGGWRDTPEPVAAEPTGTAPGAPRAWLVLGGLVCVVAVLVAGGVTVRGWPRPQPQAQPSRAPVAAVDLRPLEGPSPAPSLVVHVAGEVRDPGVVTLPAGARVADAVRAAGGLRKGGRLGPTNLARVLADGERIEVGAPSADAASGPAGASGGGGPVDLNTATAAQLDELPGIGPVTAAKILAWRADNGRFSVVDELAEVPGIGPKTLEELRPLVRV